MIMAIRGGLKCLQQEENCKHRFDFFFALLVCAKQSKAYVNGGKKANDFLFCFVLFCVTLVPAEQ